MSGRPPVIPDYELLRPIGRGAYGEVWLARSVTGIYRAAKIVHRDSFEEARPFEREFAGIQRFEPLSQAQENQIAILHVGRNDTDGYFYYVMELADDAHADGTSAGTPTRFDPERYRPRTLKQVLAQRGRLPARECLPVVIGLCNALEHLHQHGLIHRDVKPSNIIFVNGRPKLADIGLVSSVDATRSFVGTEGYVPREGPGSPAADLFSLGKVLYEAATGRSRTEFPLLPVDLETIPDRQALLELNEIIVKACADNPSIRYTSAADMRAELLLVQAGKSVKRLHAVERQLKRLVPAAVVATLAASAGMVVQQFQTRQVRERARLEAEYRKRAEDQELATRQLLYAADMNLVQQAYAAGDFGRTRSLMAAHLPRPGTPDLRGFEWYYFWKASQGQQAFILAGHSNAVSAVAFSPDRQTLATSGYDGTVKLWDLQGRTCLASFVTDGVAQDVAFSRDGTKVYFIDASGGFECRDAKTHQRLFRCDGGFMGMAIGPRDDLAAVCYGTVTAAGDVRLAEDARVRLLDSRNGRELSSLDDAGTVLRFSPDGRRLAVGRPDGHTHVWNLDERRIIARFKSAESRFDLCFSPDGRILAQGDAGGTLRLWDASGQGPTREIPTGQGSVWQVKFSPDGEQIATAGTDQTIRLWNTRNLAEATVYRGHQGEVWGISFSEDGKQIATGSKDETVRVWNIAEPRRKETLTRNITFWQWPVFSADSTLLGAGNQQGVTIWQTTDGTELGSFTNATRALGFADHQRDLWALGPGGELRLLNPQNRVVTNSIRVTRLDPATVRAHAFLPARGLLALGHKDGTIRIWRLPSATEVGVWKAHQAGIVSLAFSLDGSQLASSSEEEVPVRLWNVGQTSLRRELKGHKLSAFRVEFSPDGRRIATASPDDTCRVWDTTTGEPLAVLGGHKGGAFAVAFAPDGRTLSVGTGDRRVKLWNTTTFRDMGTIETEPLAVFFVGFAPDGQTLASVSYNAAENACSLRLFRAGP